MPRSLPRRIARAPEKLARRIVANAALSRLRATFVLSTGRVGTDTLAHLLSHAPELVAVHEPKPRLFPESQRAYQNAPLDERSGRQLLVEAGTGRAHLWTRCLVGGKRYVETSNRMTYLADILAQQMPHAQFIFLHRHPAEVVRSAMRRGYYDHHRWDGDRIFPRADDPAASHWDGWSPLERSCWYWHAVNELGLYFVERHAERCFTLRSADLFAREPKPLAALGRFLEVELPAELAPASYAPRNVQRKGEFPHYDDWTDGQWDSLREIAGETAARLGYSLH